MNLTPRRRRQIYFAVLLVVAGLGWLSRSRGILPPPEDSVERLFAERRSGVMVESEGVVQRVLRDDLRGSRHQRFILELDSGHTVLVSHNIDLAPRVEALEVGDPIALRGQYEWNEKGGVLHWTHHDPDGDRPGGWIAHRGRTYR